MEITQSPTSGGDQGSKKALLQKLMSNLLGKPGRSMHEIINGVKEAISAYRNYAKEWDSLNGVTPSAITDGSSGGTPKNSIQSIMDQIKQQKQGGGQVQRETIAPIPPRNEIPYKMLEKLPNNGIAPPMPSQGQIPLKVAPQPPIPQPPQELIAGQPQTSTFNKPAPVSNLGIHGF